MNAFELPLSSAGGADFGNGQYNDHHFHYGYCVYAAAVIGHLDPSWISENKYYVNALVRDYANPSPKDKFFPVSRSFDWYHGHSWAHGLFESADGKASGFGPGLGDVTPAPLTLRAGPRVELGRRHVGLRRQDVGDGDW